MPNGGTEPYTYIWSNGQSGSSIQVCPSTSQTFVVSVTDSNGATAVDGVTVEVVDVRCGQNNSKVLLCHDGSTLCISSNAVSAHLGHGDKLGTCGVEPCNTGDRHSSINHKSKSQTPVTNARIICHPNPASQEINVFFKGWALEDGMLEIADFSGKLVQRVNIKPLPDVPTRIELNDFVPGIYLLRWTCLNNVMAIKTFVVAHK